MSIGVLSAIAVKHAKPGEKPRKLADGGGMFLLVDPRGGKYWRLAYRFAGKQKTLALGTYPEISLEQARKARDQARENLRAGTDPGMLRKVQKLTAHHQAVNSFEAVSREWHQKFTPTWTTRTAEKNIRILELNAFPWIGGRPIMEIQPAELLAVLRRVEERGLLDTAHRLRMVAGMAFRYAVATGRAERDPTQDLRGALPPHTKRHMPAITEAKPFGGLLRDLWSYKGSFITCCALKLSALFGLRPGEIRSLEWSEVNLDEKLIRIPMGKMKARRTHLVPLAEQAVEIIKELQPLTGGGRYCFPGMHNKERPMSENTVNLALRRMGYAGDEATAHGFRSSFSTIGHGSGLWRPEVVEVQLAHKHGDATRLAYDRGDFLNERRRLMAWWANECDRMRQGAEVIELPKSA